MRRRWAIALGVVLAILLAVVVALFQISKAHCYQLIGQPVCHVQTQEKLVALSFDDGPVPDSVGYILDQLKTHDAHATFFLIGGDIAKNPGQVRRLLAAGQEVGNHSYTHQRMWGFFPGGYEDEIRRTDALLRAEGATPTLFRPPYGKKLTGLPIAVERTGYRTITWDVEGDDDVKDARGYAEGVLGQVKPGAIVLIHPMYRGNQVARDALPLILDGLAKRDYRIVSVGELLRHGAPDQ